MIPYDELCQALERFNQRSGAARAPGAAAAAVGAPAAIASPSPTRSPGEEVDLDHEAGVDISTFDEEGAGGHSR